MALLQLSQSQLTILEQCPRKFQYIYLDQLTAPMPSQDREHLTRGSQVHHLMQQHELPFPPELLHSLGSGSSPLAYSDDKEETNTSPNQIYQMAQALASAVPRVDESTVFRQSEYRLTLEWSGVILTVIYDLLVLDADQAHIFDWKTYLRPPQLKQLRQRLANHWQTKLYPFVLVETSDYSPNEVDIAYWFVKPHERLQEPDSQNKRAGQVILPPQTSNPFESECLTFAYSDRLHQETRQALTECVHQLQDWLEGYEQERSLPKVNIEQGLCGQCPFQMRCDRIENSPMQNTWHDLGNISTMPEIQPFSDTQNPPEESNSPEG